MGIMRSFAFIFSGSRSVSPVRARRRRALVLALLALVAVALPLRALDRRAFAVDVLERWSPAGWAVIERYETTAWSYTLPGRSMQLSKADFMRYVPATEPAEMVPELPTAVHEICHSYCRKIAWEIMATRHLPWRDSLALPLSPGTDLLVPLTPTFPSAAFAERIPPPLRDARFRVYVTSESASQSTQSSGVYGLLEELCAYHCGTRTAVDLVGWFRAGDVRERAGLSRMIAVIEGTYGARVQMKLFILAWLLEARAAHPAEYRAFLDNRDAVRAFIAIDEAYARTIQRYVRLKSELVAAGLLRETADTFTVGNGPTLKSGAPACRRITEVLERPEYAAMERVVREAAR